MVDSIGSGTNINANLIAQRLDAADGKQDGKIDASVWNSFAKTAGGKTINSSISISNAIKSINTYNARAQQTEKQPGFLEKLYNSVSAPPPNETPTQQDKPIGGIGYKDNNGRTQIIHNGEYRQVDGDATYKLKTFNRDGENVIRFDGDGDLSGKEIITKNGKFGIMVDGKFKEIKGNSRDFLANAINEFQTLNENAQIHNGYQNSPDGAFQLADNRGRSWVITNGTRQTINGEQYTMNTIRLQDGSTAVKLDSLNGKGRLNGHIINLQEGRMIATSADGNTMSARSLTNFNWKFS